MSNVETIERVLLAHPGHQLTLDNDGFTAQCRSTACGWTLRVQPGTPGFMPEHEHAKHVAGEVAAALAVEPVLDAVKAGHPDYRYTLKDEGWRVYCTGAGCEWSKLLTFPVLSVHDKGEHYHRKHVAHQVATAAGLGAGQ